MCFFLFFIYFYLFIYFIYLFIYLYSFLYGPTRWCFFDKRVVQCWHIAFSLILDCFPVFLRDVKSRPGQVFNKKKRKMGQKLFLYTYTSSSNRTSRWFFSKIEWLVDFHCMAMFYAERCGNRIHCSFIITFLCVVFLWRFFFFRANGLWYQIQIIILNVTINCIRWWGFGSGVLWSM